MPRTTGEQHSLGALDARSAARLVQASSDVALVLDHEGTILDVVTQVDDVATQQLRAWRGYFIVASFIIAAVVTPPDVISQLALAIPMCILYEIGILAAGLFIKHTKAPDAETDAKPSA